MSFPNRCDDEQIKSIVEDEMFCGHILYNSSFGFFFDCNFSPDFLQDQFENCTMETCKLLPSSRSMKQISCNLLLSLEEQCESKGLSPQQNWREESNCTDVIPTSM